MLPHGIGNVGRQTGERLAGQKLSVQIFCERLQHIVCIASQRAEHRHERRITRTGDGGIGKGNFSAQRRVQKISPAGDLTGARSFGL